MATTATRAISKLSRFGSVAVLAALAAGGCKPSAKPEEKLLTELGQALLANDRKAGLPLYDLELRQKLEVWDKTIAPEKNQEKQAELLRQSEPRLGDAAALVTVGEEAWKEAQGQPWIEELANGRCTVGPPAKDDLGRGVLPKEDPRRMTQEVGVFAFNVRTSVNWSPAFRVNCPKNETSFWVQMAQRKKADATQEQPLRIVRVMK